MAADVVIRAENLGKKYIIGHQTERERYTALRDVIARGVKGWGRSARDMIRGRPLIAGDEIEEFWALRDVSFEVQRGEVVGVIGRNGAGKSTLLKILSRITEPSEGRVAIEGRVASLLEVGTGFHPELTGRENIYLNGAILGMTRAEIRCKFDEIVAFAEMEKFLDTPVKRYSSGMYVRLAFAVAAHLEPEILVVDEVLAVGDAEFQKKCLGKMQDVAGHGRTVLFVSHNITAIQYLCQTAILLKQGAVVSSGQVEKVTTNYVKAQRLDRSYSARDTEGCSVHAIASAELETSHITAPALRIFIQIYSKKNDNIRLNVRIRDRYGNPVAMTVLPDFTNQNFLHLQKGSNTYVITVTLSNLANGEYTISLDLESPFAIYHERREDCLGFVYGCTPSQAHQRTMEQSWNAGYFLLEGDLQAAPTLLKSQQQVCTSDY